MIDASPTLRAMKPKDRHKFSKGRQFLGNSLIIFMGSNSAANLSSTPASLVNMDEVDKFNEGTKKETNAVDLAEQRTKNYNNFLKTRSSSPTISTSIIWEKFELGDQRRYFVPCWNCKRMVLFCWDKDRTVLKLQGCESSVVWDQEAKKPDGTWDKERVMKSARIVCTHCGFHIRDEHKTWMIRNGTWKPTNPFSRKEVRSRHLPSLYSCAKQMRFGALAVRWLELIETGRGVHGMVNGELAEPYEGQDSKVKRFEIIVRGDSDKIPDAERIMGVDVQLVAPYFWAVTRDWGKDGSSRLDRYSPLNSWDEVREFQLDRNVKDHRVFIDCRYKPAEVFEMCIRHGKLMRTGGVVKSSIGWTPCEGHDREANFRCPKTKMPRLFDFRSAQLSHSKFELPKLLFNGPQIKDILANIRKPGGVIRWEANEFADEVYWTHLDAEIKAPHRDKRTGRVTWEWRKRSDRTPNHIGDGEVQGLAAAMGIGRFPWSLPSENKGEKKQ